MNTLKFSLLSTIVNVLVLVLQVHQSIGLMKTWLDFMTRCEGYCIYFEEGQDIGLPKHDATCRTFVYGPKGYTDASGNMFPQSGRNCEYVMSFRKFSPTCSTFDRQPINDRLCEYAESYENLNKTLIHITVARRFEPYAYLCAFENRFPNFNHEEYIKHFEYESNKTAHCNFWDENLAFTFSPHNLPSPKIFEEYDYEGNIFWGFTEDENEKFDEMIYVCTSEGIAAYPIYTGYTRKHINGHQSSGYNRWLMSEPYLDSAPGVLWQEVLKPKGERTLICSIVLALDTHKYRESTWQPIPVSNDEFQALFTINYGTHGFHEYKINGKDRLYPKVGFATIQRYETLSETRRKFSRSILYLHINLPLKVARDSFSLNKLTPAFSGVKHLNGSDIPPAVNADVLNKISGIYASCRDNRILCYNFPKEEGCQTREKCHLLVAIEQSYDFKRLHFDILSHPHDPYTVVSPYSYGWMGFAFSEDAFMGGEAVFTCSYRGRSGHCANERNMNDQCWKVYISLNLEHPSMKRLEKNNYYNYDKNAIDPKFGDYQQLVENPRVEYAEIPSESQPRVLCSFDITTTDYQNISFYPKRPNQILTYDLFNKEYYLLMASGKSVVGKWQISYHGMENRASGSNLKFSKEIYFKKTQEFDRIRKAHSDSKI